MLCHIGVLSGAFFMGNMQRYSVIDNKRKREIVLLRGHGCVYKKCAFCDYYLDSGSDVDNFALNLETLNKVSGIYGDLEVINSGSVFELDSDTLAAIKRLCSDKGIRTLHFEAHYLYRDRLWEIREYFKDIDVKLKIGVETFDYDLRERVLKKGIPQKAPEIIAKGFDEVNLLFGISGQSANSMERDIEIALDNFERVCVNIMCANTSSIAPDRKVIADFVKYIYPKYVDNDRVDILIDNTDFGVGEL